MKRYLYIACLILLLTLRAGATTYYFDTTCSDGSGYISSPCCTCTGGSEEVRNSISDANGINFSNSDILSFRKGQSFSGFLTFAAVTSASSKTLTVTSHGTGTLPWLGAGTGAAVKSTVSNLSVELSNFRIDGQETALSWEARIYLSNFKDVTIDGVTGDGSVNWVSDYTPGIWITSITGDVEIKNCDLKYYGGGSELWAASPTITGIGSDYPLLAIVTHTGDTVSVHDNTFEGSESDVIIFENVDPVVSGAVYSNTLWNGGENSIDIKGSSNIDFYYNTVGRDASFVGTGGSSTSEGLNGANPLIQVLSQSGSLSGSTDINIYNNIIGPTDLVGIRIIITTGTGDIERVKIYNNWLYSDARASSEKTSHIMLNAGNDGGSIEDIEIYYNIFDGLQEGGTFYAELQNKVDPDTPPVIYNNVFYSGSSVATAESKFGMAAEAARIQIWGDFGTYCSDSTWKNNIFYINDTTDKILWTRSPCNLVMSNNIWFNANPGDDVIIEWKEVTFFDESELDSGDNWNNGPGSNAKFEDPDLNDPANDQFYLQAGAPGINTGASLSATYDDGWDPTTSFPPNTVTTLNQGDYGSGWEIGAYIYIPSTNQIEGITIN